MRPGQNKRMRGRNNNNNNNNRKGPNPLTRSYESNGPDVKIRGTAHHVGEKYLQLARDAQSSGDPVMAESYLQHAEHYFRLIAAAQLAQQQAAYGYQRTPTEQAEADDESDDDFDSLPDRFASPAEKVVQAQPQPTAPPPYAERPAYNNDRQNSDRQNSDRQGNDRQGNDRNDRNSGQPYEQRAERYQNQQQPDYQRPERQPNDRQPSDRQQGERPNYQDRQDRPQQDRQQDRQYDNRNGRGDRNGYQDRYQNNGQDRQANQDRGTQNGGNQERSNQERNNQDRPARDYDNRGPRNNRGPRDFQPREARQPVVDDAMPNGLPAFITAPVRVPTETVEPVTSVAPSTDQGDEAEFLLRPRRRRRPKAEFAGGETDGGHSEAPSGDPVGE